MIVRFGMLVSLSIALMGFFSDAATPGQHQLLVAVRVFDRDSTDKVHVDSTLAASPEGKLSYKSGFSNSSSSSGSDGEFGTRITGEIKNSAAASRSVSIKIEFSTLFRGTDSSAPVVRGEWVELRAELMPEKKSLVHCGGVRWCEIVLSEPTR